jgi:hypothetical protein
MDKRKLLTKKPVIVVTFNERVKNFNVELGAGINSEDVYVAVVFVIETLAAALNIDPSSVWNQLTLYRKARSTEQ